MFGDKEWVTNVLQGVINIRRANQKIVGKWMKECKQKIGVYVVKLTCPSSKERIRLATMMQTFLFVNSRRNGDL